jgi:hypothetical protein
MVTLPQYWGFDSNENQGALYLASFFKLYGPRTPQMFDPK